MAGFTNAQVAALCALIEANHQNSPVEFEKICNFIWAHFTPPSVANGQPGFIYSGEGQGPTDPTGVGAAILAQMVIANINAALGGVAFALEQLERTVTCYPYDRAVNPPSWQQPNLPAGAPGP